MSSVSLALPNELVDCLTIEIDCTHPLEEEAYHEDMAMFAESLHNIKNLADRNERLNTISISLKYMQLTIQRGHMDHPSQMLALQKFAHQFMLPKVAEAGLVLDTFYLELNFDAAPRNAALMRWIASICSEDSPITSDVGIGYYRVVPNKEHEAWVHYYRSERSIHAHGLSFDQFEEMEDIFDGDHVKELVLTNCHMLLSAFKANHSIFSDTLVRLKIKGVHAYVMVELLNKRVRPTRVGSQVDLVAEGEEGIKAGLRTLSRRLNPV
ncbi:hypothetical protein D6C84_07526 [Aureobasidium pullulans]|uniref:Uncharacterized protein n=1 Tax=Aureobasidium pullulans TaxID=5580 RepID=A0A4S9XQH3_AURPU|nr:hypothetical protein D6C84_07526 [Aureobasidium pullulans]